MKNWRMSFIKKKRNVTNSFCFIVFQTSICNIFPPGLQNIRNCGIYAMWVV